MGPLSAEREVGGVKDSGKVGKGIGAKPGGEGNREDEYAGRTEVGGKIVGDVDDDHIAGEHV